MKYKNKILSKPFLVTLFLRQNQHHKHSVLVHTLKVLYLCIKKKLYRLIPVAILHDIGKPFVAYKDKNDLELLKQGIDSWSFTNHEYISYQIIKNWPFVSQRTKELVKWHYILRGIQKSQENGNSKKYTSLLNIWKTFPKDFKNDLKLFKEIDDLGKL